MSATLSLSNPLPRTSLAVVQRPFRIIMMGDDEGCRIRALLHSDSFACSPRYEVVLETDRINEALQGIPRHAVDLVIVELNVTTGLSVLRALQAARPGLKVLAISSCQQSDWVFRAMQLGAQGYLLKLHLAEHLLGAVHTLLRGEVYLPSDVATCFFSFFKTQYPDSEMSVLTDREQQVLLHLVEGQSNQDIAGELYISIATVKAHLTAIYTKLGVTSRTQAIVAAFRRGLIP